MKMKAEIRDTPEAKDTEDSHKPPAAGEGAGTKPPPPYSSPNSPQKDPTMLTF